MSYLDCVYSVKLEMWKCFFTCLTIRYHSDLLSSNIDDMGRLLVVEYNSWIVLGKLPWVIIFTFIAWSFTNKEQIEWTHINKETLMTRLSQWIMSWHLFNISGFAGGSFRGPPACGYWGWCSWQNAWDFSASGTSKIFCNQKVHLTLPSICQKEAWYC